MDSFADLSPATAPPDHQPTPPFSGNSAHPPYPEMITAAIAALDDKDGSSRQAIAKYIEREYSNLPPTHPNLLTHHLKRMKIEGQLIIIKHSYALPPPRSVPFQSPTPVVVDNHFTDYSITTAFKPPETSSVTPRRKPGRPPKPRHDFGYQEHRPNETTQMAQGEVQGNHAEPPVLGSAEVSANKRGRGRPPKVMSISMVNRKRGRPKRVGGPVSGNVASPTGRESGSGRGRGRPPKNKFRNSLSKVGPGTAVVVTDPHQLVAYQELKLKYEHLQTKAKEVVGVVRPYINPDYEAFVALQELEMLAGTRAIVESEKQQSYV